MKAQETATPKKKKEKGETYEETLKMFETGMSVKQIAEERKLTESTIEGHFAKLIKQGKLDVHKVIDKDKLNAIFDAIENTPEPTLNNLKTKLGNDFSFGEIKMGLAAVTP